MTARKKKKITPYPERVRKARNVQEIATRECQARPDMFESYSDALTKVLARYELVYVGDEDRIPV